jgi:Spy/CpxP family protein refolding chaperone
MIRAAALTVLLALAPSVLAQDPAAPPGRLHHRPGKASQALGLTEAQREQLKSVAREHGEQLSTLKHGAREARAALRQVLAISPQDSEAVRAAARAVSAAQEDLAVARASRRAGARSLLTPGQQAQATERAQQRAERKADRVERKAERKAEGKRARKSDAASPHEGRHKAERKLERRAQRKAQRAAPEDKRLRRA